MPPPSDATPCTGPRLAREAADSIEVGRRLWDSWEDDAVIRDVPTGRYLDVDKLHYVDVETGSYSVKGPSIIPRPPQGQLPVLVPAGLLPRRPSRPGRPTRSWSRPRRPSSWPPSSRRRAQASPPAGVGRR